jgi:drug/metabolite transporter (DMT)-like permease
VAVDDANIAARPGLLPTLGLLYGAAFWGLVWYPSRLLEQAGIAGAWLTLVCYVVAFSALIPFVRWPLQAMRRWTGDLAVLLLAAGWTNVAFVLAVLDGEVLRVLLLFYLSPIWTVLLGRWLLHEPLTWRTAVMVGLGLAGAAVMLWDPRLGRVPLDAADLLAISAGFAFAINNVQTRRITGIGVRAKTHVAWLGVVLVSTMFVVASAPQWPEAPTWAWQGAVALGVGGFMLATLAVMYGVTHMPVQRSAVIMLFELIVGALSAWWLAGEAITANEWLGGAMILGAALIAIMQREGA